MTDSPNLALAEAISGLELEIEYHRKHGFPQTVERLGKALALLRAQPSGDWVMTVYEMCEQHKGITSYSVTLGSGGHVPAKKVCPICEQLSAAKEKKAP